MITQEQIEQAAHNDYTKNEDSRRFEPFIAGALWALEQGGWISVEERLPDPGERVMIYCHSRGVQICHRAYVNGTIDWLPLSRVYLNITHWQPLPSIPKTA